MNFKPQIQLVYITDIRPETLLPATEDVIFTYSEQLYRQSRTNPDY